ncbi:MAG: hypothetical protein ACUVR0_12095, partial [Candidatus Aminicenantales bacterium]
IKLIKGKKIIETPFSINNHIISHSYQAVIKGNLEPERRLAEKEATSWEERTVKPDSPCQKEGVYDYLKEPLKICRKICKAWKNKSSYQSAIFLKGKYDSRGKYSFLTSRQGVFIRPRNRTPEISQKFLEGGLE